MKISGVCMMISTINNLPKNGAPPTVFVPMPKDRGLYVKNKKIALELQVFTQLLE